MLIDQLNQKGEEVFSPFPFDLNLPFARCVIEGIVCIGTVCNIDDDVFLLNAHSYDSVLNRYTEIGEAILLDPSDRILKVINTDQVTLLNPDRTFSAAMINGLPVFFSTRIH